MMNTADRSPAARLRAAPPLRVRCGAEPAFDSDGFRAYRDGS